jgi:hypothetical protein
VGDTRGAPHAARRRGTDSPVNPRVSYTGRQSIHDQAAFPQSPPRAGCAWVRVRPGCRSLPLLAHPSQSTRRNPASLLGVRLDVHDRGPGSRRGCVARRSRRAAPVAAFATLRFPLVIFGS